MMMVQLRKVDKMFDLIGATSGLTANQEDVIGNGFGDECGSLTDYLTYWGTGSNGTVGVEYRNRGVEDYSGTPFWGTRGQQWDAGFIFIRPDLY